MPPTLSFIHHNDRDSLLRSLRLLNRILQPRFNIEKKTGITRFEFSSALADKSFHRI